MPAAARLPGIAFEPPAPRGGAALPRMDVAAFVGFAASGPLHLPVPVEDPARFHEIFGEDLPLARDERGEPGFAELAPAVRAFFRNGGVRCWVVRVADAATAATSRFLLPGLLAVRPGALPGAAAAVARSPGSWSDALAVSAGVTLRPVRLSPADGAWSVAGTAPGDLLRLDFDDGAVAFHPVPSRTAPGGTWTLRPGEVAHWFRALAEDDLHFGMVNRAGEIRLPRPPDARWLTAPPGPAADDPHVPLTAWGCREGRLLLMAERRAALGVRPGAWLRLDLASGQAPGDAQPVLLAQVSAHTTDDSVAPALDVMVRLEARNAWWMLHAPPAGAAAPRASVAELELRVRRGSTTRVLSGLGLAPGHPRFWGAAPADDALFAADDRERAAHAAIRAVVDGPRFPLAASAEAAGEVLLPLGAGFDPGEPAFQGPLPPREAALVRDGLGAFSADLFLDPALADAGVETLLDQAFQVRYVAPAGGPRPGRPLTGVHALLSLEEPAMVAVPDAVHRGWREERHASAPLAAPDLLDVSPRGPDRLRVRWAAAADATAYVVQASRDPRFERVAAEWLLEVDGGVEPAAAPADTPFRHAAADPGDPFALALAVEAGACPERWFFRVRATVAGAGGTPWSVTRWHAVPPAPFRAPSGAQLPAPVLSPPDLGGAGVALAWSFAGPAGAEFVVEQSADPLFSVAAAVYRGPRQGWRAWGVPDRATWFRVAARVGERTGPWSAAVSTPGGGDLPGGDGTAGWRLLAAEEYDDGESPDPMRARAASTLLEVHRALLRLCAARGDLHAVLSLPLHFRAERAPAHAAALRASAGGEERTASFGALFHPWPVVRETAGAARASTWPVAPDGTVCGALAARTLAAGAWASAANRPLAGVVALEPAPGPGADGWAPAGVNPLAQTPRGFVAATAFTLAASGELGELHVRRLLILLRRLAVREGAALVFHNLDDALQRLARRRFEEVLGGLYARGALRGATPAQAFRVDAGADVNPPAALEAGRFTVELRVAPSHPLRWVTVRLVETGGALLAEEG